MPAGSALSFGAPLGTPLHLLTLCLLSFRRGTKLAWGGSDDELIRSLPFSVLAPQGVGHWWSNHPRTHKSVLEQEATGRSHTGAAVGMSDPQGVR